MSKNICLSFASEAQYNELVDDPMLFRNFLDMAYQHHCELFPKDWADGFTFHDTYHSKKTSFVIRRVKLLKTAQVFSIRPSFLMPYMTAQTDEVEKALYLSQYGVPLSALVYVFGRDEMFWYRLILQFGQREQLVVIDFHNERNLVRVLARDSAQHSKR